MGTVAIIGGTGFIARSLLSAMRQGGKKEIRLLSRNPPSDIVEGLSWQRVDVSRPETFGDELENCEAVYYLPGILAETRGQKYEDIHYRGVVETLKILARNPPSRFIHVSAIGVAHNAPSAYHRTKKKAEEAVSSSGVPFTIVRPSLVFGDGDKSVSQFLFFGRTLHLLPMIGPGTARVQPVFAGDLAALLARIPDRPEMAGKILEVAGPRIYTYREMMEAIRKSAHLKAVILSVPITAMMASGVIQRLLLPKPILTPDVIRMALSDNVARCNAAVADFGRNLVSLESWLESKEV